MFGESELIGELKVIYNLSASLGASNIKYTSVIIILSLFYHHYYNKKKTYCHNSAQWRSG